MLERLNNLPGTEKVSGAFEVQVSWSQSLAACTGFLTLPPDIVMMTEIPKHKVTVCLPDSIQNLLATYTFVQSAQYSSLRVTALCDQKLLW